MTNELIGKLEVFQEQVKGHLEKVRTRKAVLINPSKFKDNIAAICHTWTQELRPSLCQELGISEQIIGKYDAAFEAALKLSMKRNRRQSHEKALQTVTSTSYNDLLKPAYFTKPRPRLSKDIEGILVQLHYPDQKKYLEEATTCVNNNCLRAAVILGWSAAVHHIHCKIEELGFAGFNNEMEKLKQALKGRFKKFTGFGAIESISDLRETPDRSILIMLDAMGLIDSNQRQRLEHCLDMRIHASHPGDAPITMPNLLSFFSDLSEIVFKNDKFHI